MHSQGHPSVHISTLRMTCLAGSYSKRKHKKLPELARKVCCRPELLILIPTTLQFIYRHCRLWVGSGTCPASIPSGPIHPSVHAGYLPWQIHRMLPHPYRAADWGFSTSVAERRGVFPSLLKKTFQQDQGGYRKWLFPQS